MGLSRDQILQRIADHAIADSGRRRFLLRSDHEGHTWITVAAPTARPARRLRRRFRRARFSVPADPAVNTRVPSPVPAHVSVSSVDDDDSAGDCDPAAPETQLDVDDDDMDDICGVPSGDEVKLEPTEQSTPPGAGDAMSESDPGVHGEEFEDVPLPAPEDAQCQEEQPALHEA